jgi:hypothetical protein
VAVQLENLEVLGSGRGGEVAALLGPGWRTWVSSAVRLRAGEEWRGWRRGGRGSWGQSVGCDGCIYHLRGIFRFSSHDFLKKHAALNGVWSIEFTPSIFILTPSLQRTQVETPPMP